MGMIYPMQMLLAGFTLLLAFPLATSNTITTTSKEEIKCDSCTPDVTYPSPPPPMVECPPPPSPPSPPPPSPPPTPTPPCPSCNPPCSGCPPPCNLCPPQPCNACQIPNTPVPGPPGPEPRNQQPGVMGGAVYSPPNEMVPYFPYSFQNPPSFKSAASSTHLELKLVVSIIFLLLSTTLSFF